MPVDHRGKLGALGDQHARALDIDVDDLVGPSALPHPEVQTDRRYRVGQLEPGAHDGVAAHIGVGAQNIELLARVAVEPDRVDANDEIREHVEVIVELIRRQIYDLKAIAKDRGESKESAEAVDSLDRKLLNVEEKLIQMKITGTGQDRVRWPAQLVGRLGYLASTVAVADFPPTDQQREVQQLLKQRLQQYQTELDEILQTDLPSFNRMLQEVKLTSVIDEQ